MGKNIRGNIYDLVPCPYLPGDSDVTARGIRDKPRRYVETVRRWIAMTAGAFEWSGLPDSVPPWYVEQSLQVCGWAAAIKPGEDIAIVSGLCAAWNGQYTPYYQPGGIIVTNPYATSWNGEYSFDGGAVLCRNDPEMLGLLPTISARCEMQVETDVTMLLALENLRIINVLRASTDRVKTAAETFLKRIKQGCTGIIIGEKPKQWSGGDETPPIEALPIAGVPANYLQQLIEMCQYIRGSTFNDLGLQANWNAKRESLNDSEINAGNDTLRPLIDNMLTCREQFCDEVNSRFGTEISVKLSGAWATREEIGEMQTESPAEQSTADGQSEEVPESETA